MALVLHSTTPAMATSGVPSGPHSTVHKELAEVHFGVATLGQELLCYVLEISVVLTNVIVNILLLHFL